MSRGFKDYGQRNGDCYEIGTLGESASSIWANPVETVLRFSEGQEIRVIISGHRLGKSGGGLTNEELITAEEKVLHFLAAVAKNKKTPTDLAEHLRGINFIPLAGSPPFFIFPKEIVIRKL